MITTEERKLAMMVNLVNQVVLDDIEQTVDSMIEQDARLLCRLNGKNDRVASTLKSRIDSGQLNPFDLMHDPEETGSLQGLSRTAIDKQKQAVAEDAAWLEELGRKFDETVRLRRKKKKKDNDNEHRDSGRFAVSV
jgi:TATA-binding protein-associated factor Taf7